MLAIGVVANAFAPALSIKEALAELSANDRFKVDFFGYVYCRGCN